MGVPGARGIYSHIIQNRNKETMSDFQDNFYVKYN